MAPKFVYSTRLARFDFGINMYMDDLLFVSYMDAERTRELIALL